MKPVSPVMPGSAPIEIILGAGQPEYDPLPAVYLDTPERPMVTRFELTEEERAAIVCGADIVMTQLTFRNPFQPVNLQICYRDQMPQIVELPEEEI
jgi:hypothetical protein